MDVNIRPVPLLDVELLFLITKYLESGSCKLSARVLKQELQKKKLLPKRLDWEGDEHEQTFNELEQKYPHIQPRHLLEICTRIAPILDREIKPNVNGLVTLLGAGRQSLLRTAKDVEKLWMHVVEYSARINQRALYPTVSCTNHNIVKVLHGRENAGPLPRSFTVSNQFYSKTQLLCCILGHLSAVYCLLFDRTGKYVITGADDLLVKVWSAIDGRLLTTLRGAQSEISDITINVENTLLAAGSIDRLIRVWCLQTAAPVAILTAHSAMITGVNFCPGIIDGRHCLASTSSDGSVAIWSYSSENTAVTFNPKPVQFIERTRPGACQMISAAFSSGGMFLAAGSADHYVRVYQLSGLAGPQRVLEVQAHTDRVDSIQWANCGLRFLSGSKDGTALIWRYQRQQWTPIKLSMATKLPRNNSVAEDEDEAKHKLTVTMVSWDCKDKWVVTACSDYTLKVWNSFTGILLQVLRGHKQEAYVLEGHPLDSQIFMSAGHDGLILLWNIVTGKMIASFQNNIENQGHGAVFDAKWSPDGTMMAATDSHGQILMFGLGSKPARMLQMPKELFFHTDYRPLTRDPNHIVLDEQTQVAPHLMPPPFLVDVDGNPYPPNLQRLVPGREHCTTEQLVPNIVLNHEGQQEVVQGVQDARSNIDQMIMALAHRVEVEPNPAQPQLLSPRARSGARRDGDVEGVRQSRGNWQRDEIHWTQRQLVRPLDSSSLINSRGRIQYMGELELQDYERESSKPKEEAPPPLLVKLTEKKLQKKRTHAYRTRAVREQQLQDQFEDPDTLDVSGSEEHNGSSQDSTACSDNLDSGSSSSSESASSEYSDWIKDEGEVLEPPKRKSKRIQRKVVKPQKKVEDAQEVAEGYRPSEWLAAVIPKKFPYYPQMGDEVMFFKQGYQLYLDAVKHRQIYQLTPSQLIPWAKVNMEDPGMVKVVGIRYEVRPPNLCCLRLGVMKRNGQLSGEYFTIKYHDIPDVIDFLVLKQTYDTALDRKWSVGDRFKSMIDDHWWWGRIDGKRLTNSSEEFLNYRIIWDNGEIESMSPWDMEPVDPTAEPVEVGGSIPVSAEEIAAVLYRPRPDEWPLGDRDAACERILMGLDQIMELSVAEPFIAPVDLNRYPSYATVVEYPIDLATIKARFENRFYRRITAAQFDVRYLASNTEKFNEAHSYIVKQARIVTDLCLEIIKETCTVDISSLYRQLLDGYHSSESDETERNVSKSHHRMKAAAARSMRATRREASRQTGPFDWKRECRELLEMLWACRDSEPFREPLDRLEHPEYYRIVDTPMDLGTMREELQGNNYENPEDFCDDLRRIFTNTKNYTTDKRSRVYTMAVRLSALAEQNMKKILNIWNNKNKKNGRRRSDRRRRKLLMSDDENASVSEYEPPSFKKFSKKKREMSDEDGPSTSRLKNKRGKKRNKRRQTEMNEDELENDSSNIASTSYKGYRRTNGRNQNLACDESNNSESDEDYKPSRVPFTTVNNGYSKKFKTKSQLRTSKVLVIKEKRKNNTTTGQSEAIPSGSVYSEVINDILFSGPSTSKAAGFSFPANKEKVTHIDKKEISADEDENSDSEHSLSTKIINNYDEKPKKSRFLSSNSDSEGGRKPKKSRHLPSNSGSDEEEEEESEADEESNTNDSKNKKIHENHISKEKSKIQENTDSSDISCSSESEHVARNNKQKTKSKTIKCLYPKRLETSDSNSQNLKESFQDSKSNNNASFKVNGRTRSAGKINVSRGKYPLRQITKKNLAEVSTDESNEEEIIPYSRVKRVQRPINGVSLYVENSDESDNDEEENADIGDNESDNYSPPEVKTSRGRKRRQSSDSSDCSFGSKVQDRLRTSKNMTSSCDQGRRKSLRTRKNIRNNSESELTLESNNSESDEKVSNIVSVSSRGRVRKLTARARAFLGD